MAFHDRRPQLEEGVNPNELPEEEAEELEGEGTPTDPAENNDPGEPEEEPEEGEPEDTTAGTEEAEPDAAPPEPLPKKAPVITEPIEKLEEKKAKLLEELAALRGEKREFTGTPFQKPSKSPAVFVPKPEVDDLKDVAPGDVDLIEKVLRAKGYVPKEELNRELSVKEHQSGMKTFTEAWLEKNPEFKPGTEEADEAWAKINAYASKFYQIPTDPKDVLEILDASRDRVFGKKSASSLPTKSLHSVAAKREKIAVSAKPSSGGSAGSKANSTSGKNTIDPSLMEHLKGFSEEEKAEIASS